MIKLSPLTHVMPGSTLLAVGYHAPHAPAHPNLFGNIGFAMFAAVQAWADAGAHPDTPPLVYTVATFQSPTNAPDGCVSAGQVHVPVAAIHVEPASTSPGPHDFTEDQRRTIAADLLGRHPGYEDVPVEAAPVKLLR